MGQRIAQFAITATDYDEALAFYVGKLGFERVEDTDLGGGKRWGREAQTTPASSKGIAVAAG